MSSCAFLDPVSLLAQSAVSIRLGRRASGGSPAVLALSRRAPLNESSVQVSSKQASASAAAPTQVLQQISAEHLLPVDAACEADGGHRVLAPRTSTSRHLPVLGQEGVFNVDDDAEDHSLDPLSAPLHLELVAQQSPAALQDDRAGLATGIRSDRVQYEGYRMPQKAVRQRDIDPAGPYCRASPGQQLQPQGDNGSPPDALRDPGEPWLHPPYSRLPDLASLSPRSYDDVLVEGQRRQPSWQPRPSIAVQPWAPGQQEGEQTRGSGTEATSRRGPQAQQVSQAAPAQTSHTATYPSHRQSQQQQHRRFSFDARDPRPSTSSSPSSSALGNRLPPPPPPSPGSGQGEEEDGAPGGRWDGLHQDMLVCRSVASLQRFMYLHRPRIGSSMLGAAVIHLSHLVAEDPPDGDQQWQLVAGLLDDLTLRLRGYLGRFRRGELAALVCALSKLHCYDGPLLREAAEVARERAGALNANQAAGFIWAFARYHRDFRLQLEPGWAAALVAGMAPHMATARPSSLAMTLYGMALLGERPPEPALTCLLDAIRAGLRFFQGRELAMTIWSLATLRIHPGADWLHDFLRRCDGATRTFASGVAVANVVYGIAVLGVRPPPEWMHHFMWQAQRRMNTMDAQALCMLAYGLGVLRYRPDKKWATRFLRYTRAVVLAAPAQLRYVGVSTQQLAVQEPSLETRLAAAQRQRELWRQQQVRLQRRVATATGQPTLPQPGHQPRLAPLTATAALPPPPPGDATAGPPPVALHRGQTYNILLWALVRLSYRPSASWFHHYCNAVRPRLPGLASSELAHMIWAFARLKCLPRHDWMVEFFLALRATLPRQQPGDTVLTLLGLARLPGKPGLLPPDEGLAEALSRHLEPHLPRLQTTTLVSVLLASSRVKAQLPPVRILALLRVLLERLQASAAGGGVSGTDGGAGGGAASAGLRSEQQQGGGGAGSSGGGSSSVSASQASLDWEEAESWAQQEAAAAGAAAEVAAAPVPKVVTAAAFAASTEAAPAAATGGNTPGGGASQTVEKPSQAAPVGTVVVPSAAGTAAASALPPPLSIRQYVNIIYAIGAVMRRYGNVSNVKQQCGLLMREALPRVGSLPPELNATDLTMLLNGITATGMRLGVAWLRRHEARACQLLARGLVTPVALVNLHQSYEAIGYMPGMLPPAPEQSSPSPAGAAAGAAAAAGRAGPKLAASGAAADGEDGRLWDQAGRRAGPHEEDKDEAEEEGEDGQEQEEEEEQETDGSEKERTQLRSWVQPRSGSGPGATRRGQTLEGGRQRQKQQQRPQQQQRVPATEQGSRQAKGAGHGRAQQGGPASEPGQCKANAPGPAAAAAAAAAAAVDTAT